METLIIDKHDIKRLVLKVGLDALMRELTAAMPEAIIASHQGQLKAPKRSGFSYHRPQLGLVEWMPAMRTAGPVCVKTVGYHPNNPSALDLPTILSTVSLYDTRNGHLLGIADATFLTALRTGAASAVASRLLAKPDARVLGMIGCGAQAVSQIHALTLAFPSIEEVLYMDCDAANERSLCSRLAPLSLPQKPLAKPVEDIVAKSDILCTATSVDIGAGPVFHEGPCQPWLHVNAVGSDFPGKTEVPVGLLRRAFVCPDFEAQAVVEGECQQLLPDEIDASIGAVASDPDQFAKKRECLTIFDSTGWAVEDLVAMELLLSYANELELGQRVELESISTEPHNPYHFDETASVVRNVS